MNASGVIVCWKKPSSICELLRSLPSASTRRTTSSCSRSIVSRSSSVWAWTSSSSWSFSRRNCSSICFRCVMSIQDAERPHGLAGGIPNHLASQGDPQRSLRSGRASRNSAWKSLPSASDFADMLVQRPRSSRWIHDARRTARLVAVQTSRSSPSSSYTRSSQKLRSCSMSHSQQAHPAAFQRHPQPLLALVQLFGLRSSFSACAFNSSCSAWSSSVCA